VRVVDKLGMVRRYFAILIVSWAFCGMPALCVAGVLEHPCAPHQGHDKETEHPDCPHEEPGCPHDDDCGHESDCASDPCSSTIVGRERLNHEGPSLLLQPVTIPQSANTFVAASRLLHIARDMASEMVQVPTHPSDVPLLI